ncbi:lactate racemase domain-containing protein [bacterium]|nr:lactate racemase domain-containing protein [bacterium]
MAALIAPDQTFLDPASVGKFLESSVSHETFRNKRILLIVPDSTRTAPVGMVFKHLFERHHAEVESMDVLIALGTHQPMSEKAICDRLEISIDERKKKYEKVQFFNHEWDNPEALQQIGTITSEEISDLTEGRFSMEVPVSVNKRLFDYDQIIIIGPVFPHEVVGFSGGNKYLFPGVSGPEVLNFFHWLAAIITNPKIIGHKWTAVRKVIDRAGASVTIPKLALCMVVTHQGLRGIFAGTPESAWDEASNLSARTHIEYKEKPFQTILSCAPEMYDELWVGGKCMYKLEPVLADGGDLIIYAPHIREISLTHGKIIREIGYHCRDYFLNQWETFKNYPWGILAHSTHVRGVGSWENGQEKPRVNVILATGIPKAVCDEIYLGYLDPTTIEPESYAHREHEGILYVPKAGEVLYQLNKPPSWAKPGND